MKPSNRKKYADVSRHSLSFLRREAPGLLMWACIGAIAAGSLHICFRDHNFANYVATMYAATANHFDAPTNYIAYGVTFAIAAALAIMLRLPALIRRGFRSWWFGVTSGLRFLSFVATLWFLATPEWYVPHRLRAYLIAMTIAAIMAVIQNERARMARMRVPNEKDIRISVEAKTTAGTKATESDDPIETWAEDMLGRAALVDSLTVKLLISKAPVIAVFGEFGSGKTSVLNLLREHITGKAIVVSFSTWLPGSPETLTKYLLSDIASECQREYIVPGLRQSARRIAGVLSETVPFLKGFLHLFPPPTQKDDIESLRAALRRLPKRVVVLLDELDRMQKDELLSLLKVVRGIASLPNLSFVCAAERKTVTKAVPGGTDDEKNQYLEKFFPSSVSIPKPDPQVLQKAGIERLVAALQARSWFISDEEVDLLRKRLEQIWENCIAPWTPNLRAVGLLANDVSVAAAPLRRQVDAVDLTLIELLQRFKPDVYSAISRSSVALTGGESLLRGGTYHSREDLNRIREQLSAELKTLCGEDLQFGQIKDILGEMFPDYGGHGLPSREFRPKRDVGDDDEKRIHHPGMFPAYFRYELPTAIFSAVELEDLMQKTRNAGTPVERQKLFTDRLLSMERGSLKRDDFLRKIADDIPQLPVEIGRDWVDAILRNDSELTYDIMAVFGEAGHALRMVLQVALKLPPADRVQFLAHCIEISADDTLPVRILTRLPGRHPDFDLDVKFSQLYPAFVRRMHRRYGRDVDAVTVDLSTSDPSAFGLWGMRESTTYEFTADPDDREIQHEFWLRYIGNDRARLRFVFDRFLLPDALIEGPTEPFVEAKMSVPDLRRLAGTIPAEVAPDEHTKRVETKLRRFLRGDYANGFGIDSLGGLDESDAPVSADGPAE